MRHAAKISNSPRLQKVFNMLLSYSNYVSNFELAQKCGGLVAIGSACSEINDEKNKDYRTERGVEKIDCKHTNQGFFYRAIRLGERVEEGVRGANEGGLILAESSPRVMGKGESEVVQVQPIPDMKDSQLSDSLTPPKKWDDWSHFGKEERQGGMF